MYTICPADLQSKSIPEGLHRPKNSTEKKIIKLCKSRYKCMRYVHVMQYISKTSYAFLLFID